MPAVAHTSRTSVRFATNTIARWNFANLRPSDDGMAYVCQELDWRRSLQQIGRLFPECPKTLFLIKQEVPFLPISIVRAMAYPMYLLEVRPEHPQFFASGKCPKVLPCVAAAAAQLYLID